MRKYKILLPILALILLFVSCEKENNETETITAEWIILEVSARVEIKEESENDIELRVQIENEIIADVEQLGETLKFSSSTGDVRIGTLVRTLKNSSEEIVSDYLFESIDGFTCLQIIENGVVTNMFTIQHGYLVKGYNEKFNLLDNRIVSALGVARYGFALE